MDSFRSLLPGESGDFLGELFLDAFAEFRILVMRKNGEFITPDSLLPAIDEEDV